MLDGTGKRINGKTVWIDLYTGEALKTAEMLDRMEEENGFTYGIDPLTEVWDCFATLEEVKAGIYEIG